MQSPQSLQIGQLIRDAWATTWRYRFLWILGLFAGGAAGGIGGSSRWQGGRAAGSAASRPSAGTLPNGWDVNGAGAAAERAASDAAQWATGHVALIAGAALVGVAIVLALMVLWLVAQGGMAEATVDLGTGRSSSLGRAWRAGTHLFWRYAGLWLTLALLSIVVAAFVASGVALTAGIGSLSGSRTLTGVALLVFGLPLVVLGIAVAVGVSIVVAYAQRAIAAEDEGPWAALRAGWSLLAAHPMESLLTWVVYFALAIGAGILGAIALAVTGAVLVGIGVALWAIAGMGAAMVAYAALVVLALIALVMLVAAVTNTFFWNYWTLAYLRLGGPVTQVPQAA